MEGASFISVQGEVVIISILLKRTLKLREVKGPSQGHSQQMAEMGSMAIALCSTLYLITVMVIMANPDCTHIY